MQSQQILRLRSYPGSQALQTDNAALRRELDAVAQDLAALVRENQTVMSQLGSATAERDALREEVRVVRRLSWC